MIALLFACSKTPTVSEHPSVKTEAAQDCGVCHSQQVRQWKTSRHALSWSNAIFQTSYSVATFPSWCQDCHQPNLTVNSFGLDRESGVGCLSCHLYEDQILTSNPLSDSKKSPHPLRYDDSFGKSEFCARCHQFNLPEYHPMYSDTPVQNTYQEWLNSGTEKQCQDCHMEAKGHSFPGAHDAEFLRDSIDINVRRIENKIDVSLASVNIAHAFPTGDPFRRLQWSLCRDPNCSEVLRQKTFVILHQGPNWHVSQDNRIYPDQKTNFSMPAPEGELWWSLGYFFGDPYHEKKLKEDDVWLLVANGMVFDE